jgi:hypothetical protein
MSEFVNGIFLPETRERLLTMVDRLKESEGIRGLILGEQICRRFFVIRLLEGSLFWIRPGFM